MFSISILLDGSLEILNATKNDEGIYTCLAENDRGKANNSGYLTITGQQATIRECILKYRFAVTYSCFSIMMLTLYAAFYP